MGLTNARRVVINYWFRHVWELAWPLYPGIILTVALAGIPVGTLIVKTWPAVVAMFTIGWFFYLRSGDFSSAATAAETTIVRRDIKVALREGLPLLIAIIGAVGLEALLARFGHGIPFELGVIAALIGGIGCIMVQNRLGADFLVAVLRKPSLWSMLMVIGAIFIFKDMMAAAGVVEAMSAVAGGGVALFAAAVFLPFLVGMVAGINVAFVGATFPLLIGLLHNLGMSELLVPYLVLASWRQIVAPSLCFAAFGGLLFFIYV